MKKIFAFVFVCATGSSWAAEPAGTAWNERDQLTGNWGGARTRMEESGVTPFAYYDAILGANVSGGVQSGEAFTGQLYMGVDLDLEKLLGWDATTMKISMVHRHGESVSGDVGGIYDPMCIYGGQTAYLYQFFIEKTFNENLALKVGRVSADTDFANNDLYRYSLSTAINGPIRAMLLEDSITSFPYAVWGGRAKYSVSENHQFQFGAYQIGDDMWNYGKNGTDFGISGDDGVSFLAQYDWTPDVFNRPARLYVGVLESRFDFDDYTGGGVTDHLTRFYGHADVEVIEGLKLFGFGSYTSQEEISKTPVQLSCGANWKGLFPGREEDHTMAFITYGQLSDDYGDSIDEDVDCEVVYELGHRFQLMPSCYVQPSLQYIQDPGGTGETDNAVVLGAWVGVTF